MKWLLGLLFLSLLGCSSADQSDKGIPKWINNPYFGLNETQVLATVGSGVSFDKAKESAYRELSNYFSLNIRSNTTTSSVYSNNRDEILKIDNRIMMSSNSKLTFVSYDVSEKLDHIFYVRVILDKAAFVSYLNDQYMDGIMKQTELLDHAKSNPLKLIKFSSGWKAESLRLRRIQDYLTVLDSGIGTGEISSMDSDLLDLQSDISIIIATKFKNLEDVDPNRLSVLNSAIKGEFKRIYPQFDLGTEKDNSVYIYCEIMLDSQETKGKDLFTYVSYQYTIVDHDKNVLEQSSGSAKGAGSTVNESLRQIGVKITRQITESFVM